MHLNEPHRVRSDLEKIDLITDFHKEGGVNFQVLDG